MSNRILSRWEAFSGRVIGIVLGTAVGVSAVVLVLLVVIPIICALKAGCGSASW